MKKVLVITPGVLPVPAECGGAVEKLIETYLIENENQKKYQFVVISKKYDTKIDFKYTTFKYINTDSFMYKFFQVIRYIINNKLPYFHIGNEFIHSAKKLLKKDKTKYNCILVENNPFAILKIRKMYPNTPIYLHLHNDFLNKNTKHAKKILKYYDKIITISEYTKQRVLTIGEKENIQVVYNGLNVGMFSEKISTDIINQYRKKYNIKKSDVVLMYTGRLVKEKGILELINSVIKLTNENYNIVLLVVGNKASNKNEKDLFIAKICNLASKYSNIIFTGFVSYENLPIYHNLANIQIVPSNCHESLGNVVIEGAASGIKQIITNDGGIPEIKSENAIIIDKSNLEYNLYEEIKRVIDSKEYQSRKISSYIHLYDESTYSNEIFNIIDGD